MRHLSCTLLLPLCVSIPNIQTSAKSSSEGALHLHDTACSPPERRAARRMLVGQAASKMAKFPKTCPRIFPPAECLLLNCGLDLLTCFLSVYVFLPLCFSASLCPMVRSLCPVPAVFNQQRTDTYSQWLGIDPKFHLAMCGHISADTLIALRVVPSHPA